MKLSIKIPKSLKDNLYTLKSLVAGDAKLIAGLAILIIFLVMGFVLPSFSPYKSKGWSQVPRDVPPCWEHPLGTTSTGQDLFWLLTFALQNSLMLGMVVASIGTFVGVVVGLVAGYRGGYLDGLLSSLSDIFIAIPSFPILILLAALFLGRIHILMLAAVLCLFNWPWAAKQVRSMSLSIRERTFIDSASFSGIGMMGTIFGEVMPLMIPYILTNFVNTVLVAIGAEAGLATIGASSLEEATLGTIIYWALRYQAMFRGNWWWITVPVGVIVILFIALFLISVAAERFVLGEARR